MSISERIRPGIEAAEWVCVEVAKLEVSYEAMRQRVKEFETSLIGLGGISASWANKAKRHEAELAAERAVSDKLEKAIVDSLSAISVGAAENILNSAIAELAAMRKGETE